MAENDEICHIIRMPDVVIEQILSYFNYDMIAKLRIVCSYFNNYSQRLLNRGFYAVVQLHTKCSQEVKSQLPRRESKRSHHPLAKHNNILHAVETRLSLLKMTYCKYIHHNACCFIPGKVLDELYRILHLLDNPKNTLVPHEVLTELRDISSMAMDYFEENIAPTLCNPNLNSPAPQMSPSPTSSMNVLSNSYSPKLRPFARSVGGAFDAINAMHNTDLIHGPGSSSFFPFTDDCLDGQIKSAVDSLVPSTQDPRSSRVGPTTQLVPVPLDTLTNLIKALRETRKKRSRTDQKLSMLQTKLFDVSRKVQEQERTINEQSRLLAEHSVRFSQHSRSIYEIVNNSVTADLVDLDDDNLSLISLPDDKFDMKGYFDTETGPIGQQESDDEGNLPYEAKISDPLRANTSNIIDRELAKKHKSLDLESILKKSNKSCLKTDESCMKGGYLRAENMFCGNDEAFAENMRKIMELGDLDAEPIYCTTEERMDYFKRRREIVGSGVNTDRDESGPSSSNAPPSSLSLHSISSRVSSPQNSDSGSTGKRSLSRLQHARLKRLQSTPTARKGALLKTPDGRVIAIRQRFRLGTKRSVARTPNNSMKQSEASKFLSKQFIRAAMDSGDSFRNKDVLVGLAGETCNSEEPLEGPSQEKLSKEKYSEEQPSSARRVVSDYKDIYKPAEATSRNSTLAFPQGKEGRKRKFGMVGSHADESLKLKAAKVEVRVPETTSGCEGSSLQTAPLRHVDSGVKLKAEECVSLMTSLHSPDDKSSKVAVITSEEESDEQSTSPIVKRSREELRQQSKDVSALGDLRKNYGN